MKTSMKESFTLKRPQYSSRIIVQPNTSSNKGNSKIVYSRRGNSTDTHRDPKNLEVVDHEIVNLNSLITQSTKGLNRPATGGSLVSFSNNGTGQGGNNTYNQNSHVQASSPRPNTERLSYSLSPNRAMTKSMIKFLPPKSKNYLNKKTLVLDLDETLVHSGFKPFNNNSDIILKIELDSKIHDIHVLVRPGVEEFLERMSRHYELVVFTASLSKYAEPLVDRLDPKGLCIYRLFRQHCTEVNRSFVKDLKKLDRDMKDIIILDNSPVCYALNVENGFPIKNWYDDRSDRELYNITSILEFMAYVPDVREVMRQIVEKNQISYPKALNLMNSYNLTNKAESFVSQNVKTRENIGTTPTNTSNSTNSMLNPYSNPPSNNNKDNKSMKDYINKSIQGLNVYKSSDHYAKNTPNYEEKESRYNSNLTSQKEKSQNKLELNSNANSIANGTTPNETKGYSGNYNYNTATDENKQINIKIINNHINHYIISPDNQENVKKQKSINTFRNSYNVPQPIVPVNESLNKSNNNSKNSNQVSNKANIENLKSSNISSNLGSNYINSNNYGKFNLKNLNLNLGGVEVKSPVLKNSINTNTNSQAMIRNSANNTSKYSSLIDTQNHAAQGNSRPSSAIILKGRHNREGSTNSLKNDQINLNMNPYNSPLARSPSSQSIVHHLNRNYSQQKLNNNKKETPRHSYLSNIEPPKNINLSQGYKTGRQPSADKLRINYNSNTSSLINPLVNNPIGTQLKTPSRYEVDDTISKRGYSLSSRAGDMRQQSYRYNDSNNSKYNNNTPSNKFTATGIYRSNSQMKK